MAKQVLVRHPDTGIVKKAAYGFSWTTFFFSFWPALFRGDWLMAFVGFVVMVGGGLVTFGVACLVYPLVMAFLYNGIHGRALYSKGYRMAGSEGENALAAQKWGVTLPSAAKTEQRPVAESLATL